LPPYVLRGRAATGQERGSALETLSVTAYTSPEHPNLQWLLSFNPEISRIFREEYCFQTGFQSFLENTIRDLRERWTSGLETRARELGDSDMFDSFVAELEVADVLAINGWKVEFLPSKSSNGVKPPDMIAHGGPRDIAVEVKMLTDEQVFHRIERRMRQILGETGFSARVTLGPDIAQADKFHRRKFIDLMLKDFERKFDSHSSQVQTISTAFGFVQLWKRLPGQEPEILFGTTTISIPRDTFRERIRSDILDAARKRSTWEGNLAKYPYVVALVAKDHWVRLEDVEAVVVDAGGLFISDEECRNITGILSVAVSGEVTVLTNPRACEEISDPTIASRIVKGLT
jgi:hypothetical protein